MKLPVNMMIFCGLLVSCGGSFVDKRTRNPFGVPGAGPAKKDSPGQQVSDDVPADTFLASAALPTRLKIGSELTVSFRSNIEAASFQCKTAINDDFKNCTSSDSYTFSGLVHGRGYQLQVRAMRPDGAADLTPLIISFVVDNVSGLPPQARSSEASDPGATPDSPTSAREDVIHPVSPSELPMPMSPESAGPGHETPRKLQIGSVLGLDVPREFLVTSYATTKTYNNAMHLMRIMGADTGTSLFAEEPCNREFERIVAGPAGLSYCDATPTRDQWQHSYAARIPFNHLEIVRNGSPHGPLGTLTPEEKFFVAAFDDEQDAAEHSIGITSLCSGAVTRGQTRGPLAEGFFIGEAIYGNISWCQVRDRQGRWWWLGSANLETTVSGLPVRARLIYTLAHQPAVYSGQRFATKFSERSVGVLSSLVSQ